MTPVLRTKSGDARLQNSQWQRLIVLSDSYSETSPWWVKRPRSEMRCYWRMADVTTADLPSFVTALSPTQPSRHRRLVKR
ncbi:hypothetical protein HDV63DRAFT_372163 [Trichoderma sp. SZMC 28014]